MNQKETEKGFIQAVIHFASIRSWRYYHTFDARHSVAGYPDLHLVRDTRSVFAELKAR